MKCVWGMVQLPTSPRCGHSESGCAAAKEERSSHKHQGRPRFSPMLVRLLRLASPDAIPPPRPAARLPLVWSPVL
eukprot:6190515-Pleurochrysis_carterae.AAC.2